ncbi:MAG: hypothetical protein ACPLXS_03070 [Candidatus Micrarchaeales archaeon]
MSVETSSGSLERNKNIIEIVKDTGEERKIKLGKLNEQEVKKITHTLKELGFKEGITQIQKDVILIAKKNVIKIRNVEMKEPKMDNENLENREGIVINDIVLRGVLTNLNDAKILNKNPDVKAIVKIEKERTYFKNEALGIQISLDKNVTAENQNLGNFLEINHPPEKEGNYKKLLEELKERGINTKEVINEHYYEMALKKKGKNFEIRN